MKKRILLFVVFCLILVTMMTLVRFAYHAERYYPKPGEVDGPALYGQYCASCHGSSGMGNDIGPALKGRNLKADFIRTNVIWGNTKMPGYRDMPELLVDKIVEHVGKWQSNATKIP